jgi:2-dehydropantoate 2-reductase
MALQRDPRYGSSTMKVCIYGAGAVGTNLAGRLARGGAEVAVIARGGNLAAIRQNGITVKAPTREIRAPVVATDDPATLGPQDADMVAVQAPALPSIAAGLQKLLSPDSLVCFVMNGIPWWYFHGHGGAHDGRRLPKIDPDDVMLETVGLARTVGGVIFAGCDLVAPGEVHVENPSTRLVLGHPEGHIAQELERLAAHLRDDDFAVELTPVIRQTVWSKLQMNVCSGLFGCLTNATPKRAYAEPAIELGVRRLVAEVGAIADAMGCRAVFDGDKLLARVRTQVHKTSIAQDLDAGRPIEFDAMFGAPLQIARMMNVPTPTLDLLVALVKVRAVHAGSYRG